MDDSKQNIAAAAARWVVEEGLEYRAAKLRAAQALGARARTGLPDNAMVETAVNEYIALFCAETQAHELRALRELAWDWMQRLTAFRPHLSGTVWRGTATRHSDIHIQLFCDDSKAAEIYLIDQGIRFDVQSVVGLQGKAIDVLSLHVRCTALGEYVGLHLYIDDLDAIRGALRPDASGRALRGDLTAVSKLLGEVHAGS
ncbi:MAG: hypothetical protein QE265_10715 [Rhodoferax sp.]|nr:hypothetical protein [Rhodoferax sp.]